MDRGRANLLISIRYFFREYTGYNLIFTLIGLYFILGYGIISLIYVFWIKVFGYIFLAFLYMANRKKYFYFFHNLGIDRKTLFLTGITIDSILALIIYGLILNYIEPT
ncbi:MAG: hypothetical protein ACFHWX_10100 [Bacteroidota bacterium]